MQNEVAEMLELVQLGELEEEVEKLENILPIPIHDEDYLSDLPNILEENPEEIAQLMGNFDLMINILEEAKTIEEISTVVAEQSIQVRDCYTQNMKTIHEQTKPFEKSVRSLQLLYENAGSKANVFILPIDKNKFASAATPKHFNAMRDYLETQFKKYKMEDSPFYITYVGNIGSKSAIQKMAKVAMETRALAILDIKELRNPKAAIEYAKRHGLTGIAASLGHVVIPATYGFKQGVSDVKYFEAMDGKLKAEYQKMAVPMACAFIGRMMGETPGNVITGLEAEAIEGIDGVKMQYDKERDNSEQLTNSGLVMVLNSGHIAGSSTLNKSNNRDLNKFDKIDIANALLKDLVQFCNNKAHGKWGKKEKRGLEKEIIHYLNGRIKAGLIEPGSSIDELYYDTQDEQVHIKVTILFKDIMDKFEIELSGKKGNIELQNEA